MAQVFQCDACGKSGAGVERAGSVTTEAAKDTEKKECCVGCFARVDTVLNPKPRGPKPAGG